MPSEQTSLAGAPQIPRNLKGSSVSVISTQSQDQEPSLPPLVKGVMANAAANARAEPEEPRQNRLRNWYKSFDHQVSNFLRTEITGDDLVDTEAIPYWKKEVGTCVFANLLTTEEKEKLREHLSHKYLHWFKLEGSETPVMYSETEFNARWNNMLSATTLKERNEIIGKDFREHISKVVGVIQRENKFRNLTEEQLEAIAIYSTSQFKQMNILTRAVNSAEGVAKPLHLWLNAKASVAIQRISSQQDVSKNAMPFFGQTGSQLGQETIFDEIRDMYKMRFGDEDKLATVKFVRRDMDMSWDKDETQFIKPKILNPPFKIIHRGKGKTPIESQMKTYKDSAFSSTTAKLDGVAPFNQNSDIVLIIEVPPHAPAMYISQLSAYPGEAEVLWRPGLEFEMLKVIDNRDGNLSSETELKKLWVFLRPFAQWDMMYFPKGDEIIDWFQKNISGANVVDTDKFPQWNKSGELSALLTDAEKLNLKKHLWEKYYYWFNAETRYTEAEFEKKWKEIVAAELDVRNRIVGNDYWTHITKMVNKLSLIKGVKASSEKLREWALTIAIYSSSQFKTMNEISRGFSGNHEPINLFLTAKAAVGIQNFGLIPVNKSTWKEMTKDGTFYNETGQSLQRKLLRRDANLPENLIHQLILAHYKPGNPKDSIVKDPALSSSTLNLQGVEPFNAGNVVYFIDVTVAELGWAMYIAPYSAYPKEEEVLWLPSMNFQIMYIKDNRKQGEKSTTDMNTKLQVYLKPVGRD